jgi:hypothetical protein
VDHGHAKLHDDRLRGPIWRISVGRNFQSRFYKSVSAVIFGQHLVGLLKTYFCGFGAFCGKKQEQAFALWLSGAGKLKI